MTFKNIYRGAGVALGVIMLAAGPARAADINVDLGLSYDDNLTNAPDSTPQLSSRQIDIAWHAGTSRILSPRLGVRAGAGFDGRNVTEVEALSWAQLGIDAGLWWIFGRGFSAPALSLDTRLAWRNFDSQARDQRRLDARLLLTQRWTTRLGGQIHVGVHRTEASVDSFDADRISAGLGLRWQPLDRLELGLTGEFVSGDLAVSVPMDAPGFSAPGVPSDGDDVRPGYRAYRYDTDSLIIGLGLTWQLTQEASLGLDARLIDTDPAYIGMAPDGSGRYAGGYQRMQSGINLNIAF